jgi:hypothetical protein
MIDCLEPVFRTRLKSAMISIDAAIPVNRIVAEFFTDKINSYYSIGSMYC